MKVLIGVDGSPGAIAAVQFVGRLLDPHQDLVGLCYVPPTSRVSGETAERAGAALGEAVFNAARGALPAGFEKKVHTVIGAPPAGHGLVAAGKEWSADLLAVGARGVGPIKELLLGSVSKKVIYESTVPVLVTRHPPDSHHPQGIRVVYAYDGSDLSKHGAEVLKQWTWPPGSSGLVMTVVDSIFAGQVPDWLLKQARDPDTEALSQAWVQGHDEEKAAKQKELIEFTRSLPPLFQGHPPIVAEGHPSEQILETALREKADLIVIGAHGATFWERVVLGSTAENVLSAAPCSVLVIRPGVSG